MNSHHSTTALTADHRAAMVRSAEHRRLLRTARAGAPSRRSRRILDVTASLLRRVHLGGSALPARPMPRREVGGVATALRPAAALRRPAATSRVS